ncbi:pyridoxal-phosphate-dependent aminotransferase family protein [Streptomyces sp. NPDC059525]|uniref:pyridoxal-phosphate-dependent aminotransferase family protein n=1 Tax=Streptomyces sp. NPDC059525 TaxID=3346857 RepID=UPI0036B292EB
MTFGITQGPGLRSGEDPEAGPDGPARRPVLMNPGPVMTHERVRSALAGPDMCHREPEFSRLLTRVRRKTTAVCGGGDEHTAVMLTGSGTCAVEAAISSAVPEAGGLLVIDNGHYGERLHHIARAHAVRTHRWELGWGTPVDLGALDRLLAADPGLTHVGVVHHETSTGMLNDVAAVTAIAHAHGREVVVDAVSSVGAEALSLRDDAPDWLAGSSNKCLEGAPGLSFVAARKAAFEALGSGPRRTYYLDLHRHYRAQEEAAAPAFTPGIPAFYAFDAALDLALAEGREARLARYTRLAQQLRGGLEGMGLEILLRPEHRAAALTAVRIPRGLTYAELHGGLRRDGFVIYSAQEQLAQDFFRLSTMGCMTAGEIGSFLSALERLITERHR